MPQLNTFCQSMIILLFFKAVISIDEYIESIHATVDDSESNLSDVNGVIFRIRKHDDLINLRKDVPLESVFPSPKNVKLKRIIYQLK